MRVNLLELKKHPNPLRDFKVDPIDKDKVAQLQQSIKDDGFWGGIVCRQTKDKTIQIAAGHHRVWAAVAEGLEFADVFVSTDMDEPALVRVYARENATQRGDSGTAQCGSVAAAVRYLARALLNTDGVPAELGRQSDPEKLRTKLASNEGLGREAIHAVLGEAISLKSVEQQLANLKASRAYARIVGEVTAEVEKEQKESIAALERAERAKEEAREREEEAAEERRAASARAKDALDKMEKERAKREADRAREKEKAAQDRRKKADEEVRKQAPVQKVRDIAQRAGEIAAKAERTFDFEGVAKHLKNPHQIDVFRECVTSPTIRESLPVEKQAELAAALVTAARDQAKGQGGGRELTGSFIKSEIASLLIESKREGRRVSDLERERLRHQDATYKAQELMDAFVRAVGMMNGAGHRLVQLLAKWPAGCEHPKVTRQLPDAIESAQKIVNELAKYVAGQGGAQARGLLKGA